MQYLTASRLGGGLMAGATNPILDVGAGGSWEETGVYGPGTVLKLGNSGYRMWYEGFNSSNVALTGYATSPDGTIWTKSGSNPVVTTTQTWEQSKTASTSSVVYDPDAALFKAWYHGGALNAYDIGYMTSPDGITWTKYVSNPVLTKGAGGTFDATWVADAKVIRVSATDYRMWYGGEGSTGRQIGYATSSDGITWSKYGGNPIFSKGAGGTWEDGDIAAFCPLLLPDGTFAAWYIADDGSGNSAIGYAYSSDGISWTRGRYNPIFPAPDSNHEPAASIHAYQDGDDVRIVYGQFGSVGPIHSKAEAKIPWKVIADPPDTATPVDNFNRANTGPPPSSSWTNGIETFTSGEGLVVVSNQVAMKSTGGFRQGSYYSAAVAPQNCYLIFDLTAWTLASSESIAVFGRLANVGSGTTDGYGFFLDGDANTFSMVRLDNGSGTVIVNASGIGGWSPAVGDKLALSFFGSRIQGWYKPSGGVWTPVVTADDATYSAAGFVGAEMTGSQNVKLDNMIVEAVVGDAAPQKTPLPVIYLRKNK